MREHWRYIEGYEGLYQVSTKGRVKSFLSQDKKGNPIILKLQKSGLHGYLKVSLSKRSTKVQKSIHRLVANAFIPNPELKKCVNHKDGVLTNNNLRNLEWNTQKENIQHSFIVLKRKPGRLGKTPKWNPKRPLVCLVNGKKYSFAGEAAIDLGMTNGAIHQAIRAHGGYYKGVKMFEYL